jgi:hypothetical protein
MTSLETDYLVVGAGAAGMAFTDALIADSDADVVLVDRRHRPGGHWNTAYPFVRLHQPSAFYGVNSRRLGTDSIDTVGPNAGFYERATAGEILDYYQRVLEEHLLPSGRVRFYGLSDYDTTGSGAHRFTSRLTGETTSITVRRKVVDATYLETDVPSTHTPPFSVDPAARFVPVNGLVALAEPATGYTIIGAGKTAMDACCWLLDMGIAPDTIRWIRPRDAWILDREYTQPLEKLSGLIEGVSFNLEAAAEAENEEDLFRRLVASGQLLQIDPDVTPTMYRCATLNTGELAQLRTIDNVVRRGRVLHVGAHELVMDQGSLPTSPGHVYVDCSAGGLRLSPARPIFEPDRVTPQQVRTCQPTFNAALIGFLEATRGDDGQKNALCPPNPYPSSATDWMAGTRIAQIATLAWLNDPELSTWLESARLNAARGIGDYMSDPRMQSGLERMFTHAEPAIRNLERLEASAAASA